MNNEEYIDAINKALEQLEKIKSSLKDIVTILGIRKSKRFCANCATAYVGGPVCTCGNRYTSEL
jgi:hypothetical protein